MKRKILLPLCVCFVLFSWNAVAAPVPDTGVTKCYDNTKGIPCPSPGQPFYGQDASYTVNPMSYTKIDGTGNVLPDSATSWVMVKDNVTGLFWEMKTNLDGEKNDNDPHDADNSYTWYDSNSATNGGVPGTYNNGINTEAFIKSLNDSHFGGYSDWRMPTIKELASIVDDSILEPGPTINAAYFPNTPKSCCYIFYWSSTTYPDKPNFVYTEQYVDGGDVNYGYSKGGDYIYSLYARAVRGGQSGVNDISENEDIYQSAVDGKYIDNGDNTVTDLSTGLMWQQDASSASMTWKDALSYCEGLNIAGYTDWRLPSHKELRSLVDYTKYCPAIGSNFLHTACSDTYWSSTTNTTHIDKAWNFSFYNGEDDYDVKSNTHDVRAVRGGTSGSLVVSPLSRAVPKEAGSTTFGVSISSATPMSWTASVVSGNDWLTITSGASGTSEGTITCAFSANPGTKSRTATIRIVSASATGSPQNVSVIQANEVFLISIPDTGQTKCYSNTSEIACPSSGQPFFGQDGNYNINPMYYTKLDGNGNPLPIATASWTMVRDDVTGLIWETKTRMDGIRNYSDPHDADNVYTWYDSNAATNGGNAGTPGNGTDTEDFIKSLNTARFGGFSDWRLPTIVELSFIINHSMFGTGPAVDIGYFHNTRLSWYWSSDTQVYEPGYAWGVYLDGGYGNGPKSYAGYVCAVRGGYSSASAKKRYNDNGDGTVTDNATGLMWQQDGSVSKNWEQALSSCVGSSLGGHTDWRLPTLKELQTLADFSVKNNKAAIDLDYFPNTVANFYWSSTTYTNSPNGAWGINFSYGFDIYTTKTKNGYLRAVRGGQIVPIEKLSISQSTLSVSKEAGAATLEVSNSGSGTMFWTAVVTSGSNWLRINSGIGGTNAGTISIVYDANTGSASRTGIIRIMASNATDSPKDIPVAQEGIPNEFLGAWSDAIWSWNASTNKWSKIPSTAGALMIATGKVDNDTIDDLVGVWASGLYIRQSSNGQWIKLGSPPTFIAIGDLNNDGRDDIIGTWAGDGTYYRNSSTGKWIKLSSPAKQLTAGNIGGTRDDLAGVWSDGLWVRYSADASWKKIDTAIPIWITTADMTGRSRADIVGSYSTGTYYRNSSTGAWTKITTPADQLASGDLDGDGRDDLIGIWSNSVYVRYGATGKWQQIAVSKPRWITTGNLAETVQTAGSLDDLVMTDEPIQDLSQGGD